MSVRCCSLTLVAPSSVDSKCVLSQLTSDLVFHKSVAVVIVNRILLCEASEGTKEGKNEERSTAYIESDFISII